MIDRLSVFNNNAANILAPRRDSGVVWTFGKVQLEYLLSERFAEKQV
jgi:hypothetical protein